MENTLPMALGITALGMTLLFLALGLFYGLLALLTRVVRDRDGADQTSGDVAAADTLAALRDDAGTARLRAAVAAVALARAEAEVGAGVVGDPRERDVPAVGGWWALHHGRRLAAPPSPWRGR
ncbi:MAG: hypothetical protein JXA93_22295 [Anaerolineae bacterium]|nr:hypothetical protein [Anaerolineae bacterium]